MGDVNEFYVILLGEKENFLKRFRNYLRDVWDDVATLTEGKVVFKNKNIQSQIEIIVNDKKSKSI